MIDYVSLPTPLEYKVHEGSLFCSLMYPKLVEYCLAHSVCLINI